MGMQTAREAVPAIERGCAPVYFVNGLAKITILKGGNVLFTFYRTDENRREVEVKIIVHREECATMLRQSELVLDGIPFDNPEISLTMM